MTVITADTTALDSVLDKMTDVLVARKVFGSFDENNAMDALDLKLEKRRFKHMVTNHAVNGGWSYLELTYRPSSVRIIVKTRIVDGIATVSEIDAYDHPYPSARMDYDALNTELKALV